MEFKKQGAKYRVIVIQKEKIEIHITMHQQQNQTLAHSLYIFENSGHSGKFDFYYSPKLLYSRHFQSKWQLREHRVTITIKATFFAIRACPEVCSWSAQSSGEQGDTKHTSVNQKSYPLLETQVRLEFEVLNFECKCDI